MAFRETIEAILKVKDANRFKAGMDKAARAVRKLGHDEEAAAAQTEILKNIEEKLERQSLELAAALRIVASSVDNLGDEMVQAAAKTRVMNAVMKKSGSNAVFLGKSWAFWKDRLSLTRSEILTTALTIGAYFSPAIIAMGSSFAYAAVGGGGVALGGLSTLLFSLGIFATMLSPVTDGIKKVMKAQDQYNLAVEQYGAASIQASRASAHMYGVIQTKGGKPVLDAVTNIRKLKDEWARRTTPGRMDLLDVLNSGLGAARKQMLPLSIAGNQMANSLKKALAPLFRDLGGPEFTKFISDLTDTFNNAIGPAIKGTSNFLVVMARIIRASLPYVVKLARAWQRVTSDWRKSTKDQSKLDRFFRNTVNHFKAWWGLAQAVWRVVKIIFKNSNTEGMKFVNTLTRLVNRFADWLDQISQNPSKIKAFWKTYENSVNDAVWALSHPIEAINKWLPRIMDAIATGLATHAPKAAAIFARAFANSGGWAQFLTIAWALKRFGFFKALGKQIATIFVVPFMKQFGVMFAAELGGEAAAGGLIARMTASSSKAGGVVGKAFGKAFIVGAAIGLVALAPAIEDAVRNSSWYEKHVKKGSTADKILSASGIDAIKAFGGFLGNQFGKLGHRQTGGIIPYGGISVVGESGPELASVTPRGTMIRPMGGSAMPSNGMPAIPNLEDKLHITVYSTLMVEKRQIARAVSDSNNYDTARRGGRAPYGS